MAERSAAGQSIAMKPHPAPALTDSDLDRLQTLLAATPAPLEPLDVSALDGFLCGVLLQPKPVATAAWLPWVTDMDGRAAPDGPELAELQALAHRRHAELNHAIGQRDWFDPWVFDLDEDEAPDDGHTEAEDIDDPSASPVSQCLLPWVAGFASAMDAFPGLMALDNPELVEPLALLYLHFPREDLEDADALLAVIDTLEPPADLAEAVQDLVRALMLMADVTRPRPRVPAAGLRPRGGGRRPGAGGGQRRR